MTSKFKEDIVVTEDAITIYITTWCLDCARALSILDQNYIHYRLIDIDQNYEARTFVKQVNHGYCSVPTIVFPDGNILVEPSSQTLTDKIHRFLSQTNS